MHTERRSSIHELDSLLPVVELELLLSRFGVSADIETRWEDGGRFSPDDADWGRRSCVFPVRALTSQLLFVIGSVQKITGSSPGTSAALPSSTVAG